MNEQQVRSLFAAVDLNAEVPLPPQYLDQVLAAGRASTRRRRVSMAAVVAIAVMAVAVGVGGVGGTGVGRIAPAGSGPSGPALPDRIASFSSLTNTVTAEPGGRAIMIYQYGSGEMFSVWQPLALGADTDTYRQVDAADSDHGLRPWLLSPDGTTVVMTSGEKAVSEITLVDLVTGERRLIVLPAPTGALPLAFSPDGRYLAYASVPLSPGDTGFVNVVQEAARRAGVLAVLDLRTGESTSHPEVTPVVSAAFAPDGRRIAVQTGPEAWIGTVDGTRERSVALPAQYVLATDVAWSPDGALLAVTGSVLEGDTGSDGGSGSVYHRRIRFIDATGDGAAVPAPVAADEMLGWRAEDRIVAQTREEASGAITISEIPLGGGAATVLSRFDNGRSCGYGLHRCDAYEIRMASGLLPALPVRPAGEPDRGSWPTWFRHAVAALSLAAAALGLWGVHLVRRRLRRKHS
jgi:hypothetical protein